MRMIEVDVLVKFMATVTNALDAAQERSRIAQFLAHSLDLSGVRCLAASLQSTRVAYVRFTAQINMRMLENRATRHRAMVKMIEAAQGEDSDSHLDGLGRKYQKVLKRLTFVLETLRFGLANAMDAEGLFAPRVGCYHDSEYWARYLSHYDPSVVTFEVPE